MWISKYRGNKRCFLKCCWNWKAVLSAAKMGLQCEACTIAMSWGELPGKAKMPAATGDEKANLVGSEALVVNTTVSNKWFFLTILCFEE